MLYTIVCQMKPMFIYASNWLGVVDVAQNQLLPLQIANIYIQINKIKNRGVRMIGTSNYMTYV